MRLQLKLAVLDALYRIYEAYLSEVTAACAKHCAACCTCNVSATTIEAYNLLKYIKLSGLEDHLKSCSGPLPSQRFRPRITINQMAALCLEGKMLPEETAGPPQNPCPFLSHQACLVYPARPFNCRCMLSVRTCKSHGFAEMDPFTVTVNEVFWQYIEHVDTPGCTGNLLDTVRILNTTKNQTAYARGALACESHGLISNQPIPALMIPPEHRQRMQPIIAQIQEIKTGRGG